MNNLEKTKEELIKELQELQVENNLLKESFENNISKHKLTEEKLKESEEKYLHLIDKMPDGIYKSTPEGKFIDVNNSLVKMLGYDSKEELMSIDIKTELYFNISDREDTEQNKNKVGLEICPMKKKDGSEVWLEDHGWINYGKSNDIHSYEGILRDVSERKLVEVSIFQNLLRYKTLLQSSKDGIHILDEHGNIVEVNDAFCNMLGYNRSELMNLNVADWDTQLNKEEILVKLQELIRHPDLFQTKHRRKDGSVYDAEINGVGILLDRKKYIYLSARDITGCKHTEKLLQDEHVKLIKMTNQVPGVVYQYRLHPDGSSSFPYASEGIKEIYRLTPEEVMIDATKVFECIHTDDKEEVEESIMKSAKELSPWNLEYRVKFKDGTINTLYGNSLPQLESDGSVLWHGFIYNITQRKLSEEKLHIFSQAVEQSPVTILITDTKGIIQYVNPKFIETTGYSLEEVIGNHTRVLKSGHTSAVEYKELWETISAGKDWHGEFHNKKKNGELYWESASISPIINEKGEMTHYIAIKEEISYRKESEILLQQKNFEIKLQNKEYKHLNKELLVAKNQAEKSDRLKTAFLANMSHEIRTPMNGILGFAGLLKEQKLTGEEQKEYIDIIEKSGVRMLNIINDIIDISKIESGLMKLKKEESNINDQIEYVYTFFKPEVESKGMKLIPILSLPSKDSIIKTDREKVFAILINLVKNAIKYSNEGSIEFGYIKKGGFLEFFVKDSGIGIHKNRHKAVFERFIQADITDKMATQGAGLGLSISKAFVEMLGGEIWLESDKDKGSTFYFTVPYKTIIEDKLASQNIGINNEIVTHIKKIKILIAEDDQISRLFINKAVQPFCNETLNAKNGLEAVEAFHNNQDIDLVLMDIKMPIMNGYEATQEIRQYNKDIIIIAQSAFGLTGDKEKAIIAGCNDYITKPINKDELVTLLYKYFAK